MSTAAAGSLFEDDAPLAATLEGPVQTLIDDVKDRARHSMKLTVDGHTYPIEASVRGKSRTRVCEFPPIRLYFDEDSVAGTLFEGQDKLKLVTHCRNHDPGELNLVDEYAAYRVLGVLTEVSYRTRLLRITYADTDGRLDSGARERYGFLLESRDEIAARIGGEKADVGGVRLSELAQDHVALMYVFEYLIGNTDWSLVTSLDDEECCHNMDLIRVDGKIFPIPYDFDLAGIVDAPYAKPDPSLRIKNVKRRRYRGYCIDEDVLRGALGAVRDREQDIIAAVREIPGDQDEIDRIVSYLAGFFREAENEDKLLARFERRCL